MPRFLLRAFASQGWFWIDRCPECDATHRAVVIDKQAESSLWWCFNCKHGGTFKHGRFKTYLRPDLDTSFALPGRTLEPPESRLDGGRQWGVAAREAVVLSRFVGRFRHRR